MTFEWFRPIKPPGSVGRPATQPCGTDAGAQRHRRAGEKPCAACREAARLKAQHYNRLRAERRRAEGDA